MQLPIAAGRTWTGGRRGPYLNDNSVMLAQRIPIAGARSGTVYRGAKNIPRKGPQNCRSLHGTPGQVGFARDDKEKGRDSVSKSPLKSLSSPLSSRAKPTCPGVPWRDLQFCGPFLGMFFRRSHLLNQAQHFLYLRPQLRHFLPQRRDFCCETSGLTSSSGAWDILDYLTG